MKIDRSCLLLALLPCLFPAAALSDARTLDASGQAEIRVAPDEVVLTLGVETDHLQLETAKGDNDRRVTAVVAAARQAGVAAEHIQTDYLTLEPRWENNRRDFLGYLVRRSIAITLRDLSQFEDLLSSTLEAGASHVHGIDFRTTELRRHRDHARARALEAARDKARAMAGELGQRIGDPLAIREGHSGWWSGYGSWWRSNRGGSMVQNVVQVGGESSGELGPTRPGQISVTAQVSVTFELVD